MWFPGYQLFSGQLLSEGGNWFSWICAVGYVRPPVVGELKGRPNVRCQVGDHSTALDHGALKSTQPVAKETGFLRQLPCSQWNAVYTRSQGKSSERTRHQRARDTQGELSGSSREQLSCREEAQTNWATAKDPLQPLLLPAGCAPGFQPSGASPTRRGLLTMRPPLSFCCSCKLPLTQLPVSHPNKTHWLIKLNSSTVCQHCRQYILLPIFF